MLYFVGRGDFCPDPPMGCGASIDGSGTLRNGKVTSLSSSTEGDGPGDAKNNSGASNHSLDAQLNSKVRMGRFREDGEDEIVWKL